MKLLRDGLNLFFMVVFLLVLPRQNWTFWLSENDRDWYGELVFHSPDQYVVLAKNGLSNDVLFLSGNKRLNQANQISASISSRDIIRNSNCGVLPAESYSMVVLDQTAISIDLPKRKIDGESKEFSPTKLLILTQAEDDLNLWLLIASVLFASGLAFSIGLFSSQVATVESGSTREQ